MDTKFCAMIDVAEDKYFKLVDSICRLRDNSEGDFENILKLINSIHRDEIDLIVKLRDIEIEKNNPNKEIKIPSFMIK